jgi:deazaflavin-dependent oxidoreductase (nitroreductase family)
MDGTPGVQRRPARWISEPYLYVTTIGRRTGRPHRIEIWFAAHAGRLYLLSGGRERADRVRNTQANPLVTVELGDERHVGVAHVLGPSTAEDQLARELLVDKYADSEDNLDKWGPTSLPVVIEFRARPADPLPLTDEHHACRGARPSGGMVSPPCLRLHGDHVVVAPRRRGR